MGVARCSSAVLLTNGDGSVRVRPAVLRLTFCIMAMSLYQCGQLSAVLRLTICIMVIWPVRVRPHFLRLTCCLMTMDLHECGRHGPLNRR